jgi:predicted TIM-barrel fold metal-dependent hydrolase
MVVDFQHHYTPPELMEIGKGDGSLRLDENGNPNYRFNPLLADLSAHVRMMDKAGIDVAVLSCGSGFDQPNLAICRLINDRMHQAERDHPGRFIGLAHVPALNSLDAETELKRCVVELASPGSSLPPRFKVSHWMHQACARFGGRLPTSGSLSSSIPHRNS